MCGGDDLSPELISLMLKKVSDVLEGGKGAVVHPVPVFACPEYLQVFPLIKRVGLIELHAKIHGAFHANTHVLTFPHPVPG